LAGFESRWWNIHQVGVHFRKLPPGKGSWLDGFPSQARSETPLVTNGKKQEILPQKAALRDDLVRIKNIKTKWQEQKYGKKWQRLR